MINFVFFFLKIENFDLYKEKEMVPVVPIGAAGEKFLKFDTFSTFLRHFFARNTYIYISYIIYHIFYAAGEKFENCPPLL